MTKEEFDAGVLKLINDYTPEGDAQYHSFTLLAHNDEGVRMIAHNISSTDLLMQSMVLVKELKKEQEEEESVKH